MTSAVGPSGIFYETNDPAEVHNRLWDSFSGELAFDVGANYGQSLRAMVTAGRFARAVACEPSDEAWLVLEREFGTDSRVTLARLAISDHCGQMQLSACEGAIRGGELLNPAMVGNSPDPWFSGEYEQRTVPCWTLDFLSLAFGMPQLVKVDTEGSEVLVLQGAATLMGKTEWLVEWHSPALRDQCIQLLESYHLEVIPYPYPGGVLPYDAAEPQNGWLKATLW